MNNTEIVIVEAITVKYYSKGAFLNRFDLTQKEKWWTMDIGHCQKSTEEMVSHILRHDSFFSGQNHPQFNLPDKIFIDKTSVSITKCSFLYIYWECIEIKKKRLDSVSKNLVRFTRCLLIIVLINRMDYFPKIFYTILYVLCACDWVSSERYFVRWLSVSLPRQRRASVSLQPFRPTFDDTALTGPLMRLLK